MPTKNRIRLNPITVTGKTISARFRNKVAPNKLPENNIRKNTILVSIIYLQYQKHPISYAREYTYFSNISTIPINRSLNPLFKTPFRGISKFFLCFRNIGIRMFYIPNSFRAKLRFWFISLAVSYI